MVGPRRPSRPRPRMAVCSISWAKLRSMLAGPRSARARQRRYAHRYDGYLKTSQTPSCRQTTSVRRARSFPMFRVAPDKSAARVRFAFRSGRALVLSPFVPQSLLQDFRTRRTSRHKSFRNTLRQSFARYSHFERSRTSPEFSPAALRKPLIH